MLVDILGGRLIQYAQDGSLLKIVRRPGQGPLEFNHPTQLFRTESGFLLKERADHLIWLDSDFEPVRALDFRRSAASPALPPGVDYLALFDQAQVGDEIVAFGTLARQEEISRGFLRVDARTLEVRELVEEVASGGLPHQWYTLSSEVVAETEGAAYGLRWSESPYILRLSPPSRRLQSFPPEFRRLPTLPPGRGPQSDPERFRAVEQSVVADGLYARGSHLYLSTRRPAENDGIIIWEVHQIDPLEDHVLGSVRLPSTANHILLVPGDEHWLVVEKGPMVGPGEQEISSAVIIPSDWIEDLATTPLAGDALPNCG